MITPELTALTHRLQTHITQEDTTQTDILAPTSAWNLSQTIQHCAQTVRFSVVGYPQLKPALFRATAGRLAKHLFLRRGATRHSLDAEIAGAPPLAADKPAADAAAELAEAVELFTGHTGPHATHPAYGRCTHEQFERLHAMHLAEHLPGLLKH